MFNKLLLTTFYTLLEKDITIYNKKLIYRSIDAIVWMSSSLLVTHNLMPLFGIKDPHYGTFVFLGNLAVWGLFEMLTSIALFIADIQGDKAISYYMSLPIPSYLLFIEEALASAYRSIASSILMIPLGKIILGKSFIISNVHWFHFFLALCIINIFYGFLTIFVASYIPDLAGLTMVRSRIMFPLWFLGGFQFSWKMLKTVCPSLAYISLCNPLFYVMEGLRSTGLPAENYIPFWCSMSMLICFSILFAYIGIYRLKKRLDCI